MKHFTKKDLKTGDIVLRRNGEVQVVLIILEALLSKNCGSYSLGNINDDLTSTSTPDWDIVAVRRPTSKNNLDFDIFDRGMGELVYERKEVEEMTLEEVCKALGKEIKIVKEKR